MLGGGPVDRSVSHCGGRQSTMVIAQHTNSGQRNTIQTPDCSLHNKGWPLTSNGGASRKGHSLYQKVSQKCRCADLVPYVPKFQSPELIDTAHHYPYALMYRNDVALFQRPYLSRSWSDWDAVKCSERRKKRCHLIADFM